MQEGFLRQPVIDIWAYRLRDLIVAKFPEFHFPERQYTITPVIDVPVAYYFRYKGFLRTMGGFLGDLLRFRFYQFYQRFMVITGFRRDPYDSFRWIINRQKTVNQQFQFFFLIGDYSTYDKNISVNNKNFVSLIKAVGDYCKVGLKASFLSLDNAVVLKMEKKRLEHITNRDLKAARNSFSKLNLPQAYRHLNDLEIQQDFTMGYINQLGFRAGTCTPFLFYDLDYEIQTPLQVVPYQCLDFALLKFKSQLDRQQTLELLIDEVKGVNGNFVPVFHNYSLGNSVTWTGFRELFNFILDSYDKEPD